MTKWKMEWSKNRCVGSANQNAYMIHGSSAMNVVDTVAGVAVLYPAHNILGKVGYEENKSGRQLSQ